MHLRRPAEFKQVFTKGKAYRQPAFTIIVQDNGLDVPRLGLAVSRRTAARAVVRNRIKRIVRESFRGLQRPLAGLDVVVVARPLSAKLPPRELRVSLDALWRQIGESCGTS
ncbi:MAG: ribonuclease P protein component [Gammaproteobacteria bacterium]|nr:MAG: ribonuclease P protein component [Gammaproteobacteria bacterium]